MMSDIPQVYAAQGGRGVQQPGLGRGNVMFSTGRGTVSRSPDYNINVKTNNHSDLLKDFDPMLSDFNDPDFNTYNSGPGNDLPVAKQRPQKRLQEDCDRKGVELYVVGIPLEMTDIGLRNLFSRAGKILSSRKMRPKSPDSAFTFGFVSYDTVREAEEAIRRFDGFQISKAFKLRVRISLSEEHRTKRLEERRNAEKWQEVLEKARVDDIMGEDAFLQNADGETVTQTKNESPQTTAPKGRAKYLNELGMGRGVTAGGRLLGSRSPGSSSGPSPAISDNESSGSDRRVGLSRQVTNQSAKNGQSSYNGTRSRRSPIPHNTSGSTEPSSGTTVRKCSSCHKKASLNCKVCKTTYCSRECQIKDWPVHKLMCRKKASIEEDIENRFEISVSEDFAQRVAEAQQPKFERISAANCLHIYEETIMRAIFGKPAKQINLTNPKLKVAVKLPVPTYSGIAKETLARHAKTKVTLTHITTPSDLWVVKTDRLRGELHELQERLQQHYANSRRNEGPGSFLPTDDELCACQFSRDGQWYRARVDRINLDATVGVTYVDYGNKEEVPATKLRQLTAEFSGLPIQGIHCSLNLSPRDGSGRWSSEVTELIQQVLKIDTVLLATPIESTIEDLCIVDLVRMADSLILCDYLISMGCDVKKRTAPDPERLPADQSGKLPQTVDRQLKVTTPTSQPVIASNVGGATPPVRNHQEPSSPQGTKVHANRRSPIPDNLNTIVSVPDIPVPGQPTVAKMIDSGDEITFATIHLDSPDQFWVQVNSEQIQELEPLQAELNTFYSQLPTKSAFSPNANGIYATKFSEDGAWYRAQLLEFDTHKAQVVFLDYGNREEVQFVDMHSLRSSHSSLCYQALRCGLASVCSSNSKGWTHEAVLFFKTHLANSVLKATVAEKDSKTTWLDIVTPTGKSLNQLMIDKGFAVKKTNVTNKPIEVPVSTLQPPTAANVQPTINHSVSSSQQSAAEPRNQLTVTQQSPKRIQPPVTTATEKHFPTVSDLSSLKILNGQNLALVTDAPSPDNVTVQIVVDDYGQAVNSLLMSLSDLYHSYNGSYHPQLGELVAAKFNQDGNWYRATVLDVADKSIRVRFVDYGNLAEVTCHEIAALAPSLLKSPVQAVTCCLAGIGSVAPGQTWSPSCLTDMGALLAEFVQSDDESVPSVILSRKGQNTTINDAFIKDGILMPSRDDKPPVSLVRLEDLTTVSLKLNKNYTAGVSDVSEAGVLTVHIAEPDYMKMLQKLIEKIRESVKLTNTPKCPVVHQVVLAQYSADNMWYRADILELNNLGEALVQFIDYGNIEKIGLESMRNIPEELVKYPIMGVPCMLRGVSGTRHLDRIRRYIPQTAQLKVIGFQNMIYEIELFDASDGSSVNEIILNDGTAKSSSVKLTPTQSIPGKSSPSRSTHEKSSSADEKEIVMSPSVEKVLLPVGKQVVVRIMDAPSPYRITLIYEQYTEQLKAVTGILSNIGESDGKSYYPVRGELVVAKFSDDNCWYRAEVLEVLENNKISVRFTDYGNVEKVDCMFVRTMPPNLLKYPLLGLMCALEATNLPIGANWHCDRLQLYQPVKLLAKTYENGVYLVDILTDHGDSLCDLLSRGKTCDTEREAIKAVTADNRGDHRASLEKFMLEVGQDCIVQVTDARSPVDVTVQLIEEKAIAILHSLEKELTEIHANYTGSCLPQVGDLVTAKYSDGHWYRAEVRELRADSKAFVRFIDYGNCEEVRYDNLHKMAPSLFEFPVLGIQCALANVTMSANRDWNPDYLLSIQVLSMKCIAVKNHVYQIELYEGTNDQSLNETLVKKGLLLKSNSESIPAIFTVADLRRSDIAVGTNPVVQVTNAISPSDIVIQVVDETYQTILGQLRGDLAETYSGYNGSYMPKMGELIAAKFSEDNDWYRAEVLNIFEGNRTLVNFVDFGNSEELSADCIGQITESLLRYQILGIKCRLVNCELCPGQVWENVNLPLFKVFFAAVKSKKDEICEVDLIDIDSGESMVMKWVREGVLRQSSIETETANKVAKDEREPSSSLTVPTLSDLQQLELPINQIMLCRVTDARDAQDFTVQIFEGDVLQNLVDFERGIKVATENVIPYSPKEGEIILAQYAADNSWYRAVVLQLQEQTALVEFIDYGNREEVTSGAICKLPPSFNKYPIFGIPCSLANATLSKGRTWESAFLKPFEHQKIIITKKEKTHCVVELSDPTSGNLLSENLIKEGIFSSRYAVSEEDRSESRFVTAETIPRQTFTEETLFVPCCIVGPQEFYIQCADGIQQFCEFHQLLNQHYSDSVTIRKPIINEVACVFSNKEQEWYRAVVIKSKSDGSVHRCAFLDFGNSEVIEAKHIRKLAAEFSSLPKQAIRCSLAGITNKEHDWSSQAIQKFSELLLNKICRISFVSQAEEPLSVSDIIDDVTEESVLKTLFDANLITSKLLNPGRDTLASPRQRSSTKPNSSPSYSSPDQLLARDHTDASSGNRNRYSQMMKQKLPDKSSVVAVLSHAVSPDEFYIQVVEAEIYEPFRDMLLQLQNASAETPAEDYRPRKDAIVSAEYQGFWYRARVLNIIDDSHCRVVFFDFGNIEEVLNTQIRQLPQKFIGGFPEQGIVCSLSEVCGLDAGTWTPEALQWFQSLVLEQIILTSAETVNGELRVKLECGEFEDVGKFMVSHGLALFSSPASRPTSSIPSATTLPPVQTLLQVGSSITVTHLVDPDCFYCQMVSSAVTVREIMATLAVTCSNTEPDYTFRPEVGEICGCLFSEDNGWYRAQILTLSSEDVVVTFIDFGNSEKRKFQHLRRCSTELMKPPPLAFKCRIKGVAPVARGWQLGAVQLMRQLLGEYVVSQVTSVHQENDLYVVNIINSDNMDVAYELVHSGLATAVQ